MVSSGSQYQHISFAVSAASSKFDKLHSSVSHRSWNANIFPSVFLGNNYLSFILGLNFLLVSVTRSIGFSIYFFLLILQSPFLSFLQTEDVSTALYTELCSFGQQIVQWPLQLLKTKIITNSLFSFSSSGLLVSQEGIRMVFSWGKSSSAYLSLCSVPPC